jgi:hypothetical protein
MMSDKRQVVSAPMSLNGSYLRTVNLLWFDKSVVFRAAVGWWLAALILFFWWGAIVVWYVLFGLLLVPYRLIRRGGRNRKIAERRHQELIQALKTPGADKSALAGEIVGSSDDAEGGINASQLNWRVLGSIALIAWGTIGGLNWFTATAFWWGRASGWALVGNFSEILFLGALLAAGIYFFQRYKE